MTSDEIYKLIEANGLTLHGDIEHFAALVASAERERIKQANAPEIERINAHIKELKDAVKAEREACARVCDDINAIYKWPQDTAERVASQWCADAIRLREKHD